MHEGLAQELLQEFLIKIEQQKATFTDPNTFTMNLKFTEAADHFKVGGSDTLKFLIVFGFINIGDVSKFKKLWREGGIRIPKFLILRKPISLGLGF